MIACKTTIGFGAPTKAGKASAHGSPLGADEIKGARASLGWAHAPFEIPADILSAWCTAGERSKSVHADWSKRLAALDGAKRAEFERRMRGDLPKPGFAEAIAAVKQSLAAAPKEIATRTACEYALESLIPALPEMVGGSADLTGSNNTRTKSMKAMSAADYSGRFIHYGIREHGMGGVMTGMAAHGGIVPVGGTFFVFSDYMRGAVRVAALSNVHVIYSWTHDSIGLGQDGPTHQPIEQLAAMRAMPNLRVIRPADANETAQAWRVAIDSDGPTALILSRQEIPVLAETAERAPDGLTRGAYVLREPEGTSPQIVLIGTGSEVHVCLAAADLLAPTGVHARVVSFPSWDLFALQPDEYQHEVFPDGVPRLAVEAASSFGWERYADATVCIDHFGASAPGDVTMEEFGFTPQNVATQATTLLALRSSP